MNKTRNIEAMGEPIASGQITIVDLADLGQLSVNIASNHPQTFVYNPNDESLSPNLLETNLILTPVVYYGNQLIGLENCRVTWTVDGINIEEDKTVYSSIFLDGKGLCADGNFLSLNRKQVVFSCSVEYDLPFSGVTLEAFKEIGFSLIESARTYQIFSIKLTGDNSFLYDYTGKVDKDKITIRANCVNCDVSHWYYYDSNGLKQLLNKYVNSKLIIEGNKLTIYPDHELLQNQKSCTFRASYVEYDGAMEYEVAYDEVSINKIYDGAPGNATISAILTNETHAIPFKEGDTPNSEIEAESDPYINAYTFIKVFLGMEDVTDKCTFSATPDQGVTGSFNETDKNKYEVSKITNSGKVFFEIKYEDITLYKNFSLIKTRYGVDGKSAESYQLQLSTQTIKREEVNGVSVFTPAVIQVSATKTVGNVTSPYNDGKIMINNRVIQNGQYSVNKDDAATNGAWTFYLCSNENILLDSQSAIYLYDGVDTFHSGLGNYTDQIACDEDGIVIEEQVFEVPYFSFQGSVEVNTTATFTTPGLSGISLTNLSDQNKIQITIQENTDLSGYSTINIPITLSASVNDRGTLVSKTSEHIYSLTVNLKGAPGEDSVVLQVYAQNGGVFINQVGTDTLIATLYKGGASVSSGVKWQWFKLEEGGYAKISGKTNDSLEVLGSEVHSLATYKIEATYDSKTYTETITVTDKSDPLQVYVHSTIGDKIINSQGYGLLYARVYQNGEEIDSIQGWYIQEDAPSSPAKDNVWVKYDEDGFEIKKYSGTSWVSYDPKYKSEYEWFYEGQTSTEKNRFLLVNSDTINKKTTFNIEITYPKIEVNAQ